MKGDDLWEKYCSFYKKDFSDQMEYNKKRMDIYFHRWKKTDLAKMLCQSEPRSFRDVPITAFHDYTMLSEFRRKIVDATKKTSRKPGELFREYYDHITRDIGSSLDRYMTEPYSLCMKTTGTTGQSKWIAPEAKFSQNVSP